MCGIVGFVGNKNAKLLNTLLDEIEHRGRDDRAEYFSGRVHMGMNRLAIVDLRKGIYPIRYKQYILLYNGEIYNHEALREQLAQKNIYLPLGCDAYVILPLFDLYKDKAFALLEGMFALSIYDTKRKELVLARDKSGEKPLYYAQTNDIFAYASETRALIPLLPHSHVRDTSMKQYLSKGYVFGRETILDPINKVLPSECLVYSQKQKTFQARRYWKPKILRSGKEPDQKDHRYVQTLQSLVEASVKSRMLSDVAVGCFLSGGIDSALVAHFASKIASGLRTYSVAFPGFVRNDEAYFARFAARTLGTNHTEVICTPKSLYQIFSTLGDLIDEPISDPAILPTLLLSQEARKSVKVVLTGEGADEVFAGYPRYMRQLIIEQVRSQKMLMSPLLFGLRMLLPHRFTQVAQSLEARYAVQRIWSQGERRLLNSSWGESDTQIYYSSGSLPDPLLRMQLSDYRGYLSEQLFMKADKSTMAFNLESRAPYVDTDIMNFAFTLPGQDKAPWFQGKYLLKRVASLYFPWWFVWRPKHGFSVPLREWFCDELKSFALESVANIQKYAPSINHAFYASMVDDHLHRRSDNADKIWSMLVMGFWLKRHSLII